MGCFINYNGGKDNYKKYSSFNTNYVSGDYRGMGLQRLFLRLISELAAKIEKKAVVCTVSPSNLVSYNNFKAAGDNKTDTVTYKLDNRKYSRDFLEVTL